MRKQHFILLLVVALLSLVPTPPAARTQSGGLAPGAPGRDAQWPSAGKEAVGTSNTLESKVWFTLRGGVMDEVYYPTVDVANSQRLAARRRPRADGESIRDRGARHRHAHRVPDAALALLPTDQHGEERRVHASEDVTRPIRERNVVLIDVQLQRQLQAARERLPPLRLLRPLARQQRHARHRLDRRRRARRLATATRLRRSSPPSRAPRSAAARASSARRTATAGTSDGLTQMAKAPRGTFPPEFVSYARAEDGNVVQLGELPRLSVEATAAAASTRSRSASARRPTRR